MACDLLVLDAGQTGSRYELRDGNQVVRDGRGGPVINDHPVLDQLAAIVRTVLDETGESPSQLSIGSTGLRDSDTALDLLKALDGTSIRQVRLAHDSITSYLGALGDRPGVVIASGTGVVTLAMGASTVARVDGWGYLLGDAGSGFWIGKAGLSAVMRAYDGRGPKTALTDVVRNDFHDLDTAYVEIQNSDERVKLVASYAKKVAELAPTDQVCLSIVVAAATEMAKSVAAGLERVRFDANATAPVAATGNVFSTPVIRNAFEAALAELVPQASVSYLNDGPLAGAARMASLKRSSPLFGKISTAEAI